MFISEIFLDTPLFRLIRFRQKVLTVFAPLELFSLKEKAAHCQGGLLVSGAVVSLQSSGSAVSKKLSLHGQDFPEDRRLKTED